LAKGGGVKTQVEILELVRHAVAETLRKKGGVKDDQKIGQDLGAESIDRIDLTFRLEEVLEKSLDEKILFAEPDPSVADLAGRLAEMLEEKK
jgi:acyl carrier protein